MAQTTAQFLLDRLADDWGVSRVYGYPGDGIGGLTGAFHEVGDRLAFTQVRHEEIAAFAATAHAKLTGEVGVCLATSGPGAIHLLNGLYDAKLDHQPVLAIVGQQARMSLGSDYQQEVDLVSLFKDVAGAFVQVCMVPEQARAPARPRDADRQGDALADLHHRPQRRPGAGVLRAAARPRRGAVVERRDPQAGRRARRLRLGRGRGGPQRGRARGDPRRRGRQGRGRRRSPRSPSCSAPARRARSTAARSCPTTCRG